MDKIFGLYGAGGYAREVMPLVAGFSEVYFIETKPENEYVNGYRVLSEEEFLNKDQDKYFNIAIAESKARESIANRLIEKGAKVLNIKSENSIMYSHNVIKEGYILCANTVVTSNATIGKFFHGNIYSYVAHDCVIGDFVTFAPNVHCNGNVHIEDHAYIGTGAILKQGTKENPLVIGKGAVVGMGAVVTKSVPAYTTVVGNPAKALEKK